jgi:phospholipase/carboxylesterase
MITDLPYLSGPIFEPASNQKAQSMVLLLHGYGANGDDLIGLAPPLSQVLPNTVFISPNAPFPCSDNPGGFQWFDVWQSEGQNRVEAVRFAEAIVNKFVDRELENRGLDHSKLFFVGFSQGTMLSLQVGLRRERPCAGILGYSGRLEMPELLSEEIRSRVPVMLIHGEEDPLLPIEMMESAEKVLKQNGVEVTSMRRPGLGHGIDPEGLKGGAAFLTKYLEVQSA